jgi:hypothetical protein
MRHGAFDASQQRARHFDGVKGSLRSGARPFGARAKCALRSAAACAPALDTAEMPTAKYSLATT